MTPREQAIEKVARWAQQFVAADRWKTYPSAQTMPEAWDKIGDSNRQFWRNETAALIDAITPLLVAEVQAKLDAAIEREQRLARRIHMQRSELRWMNNMMMSNAGHFYMSKIAGLLAESTRFVHPDRTDAKRQAWRRIWKTITERRVRGQT